MNIKRMSLRFNLDNDNDRIAWEYLQDVEESRNKAVIDIIRRYAENDRPIVETLKAAIVETINDCLSGVTIANPGQAAAEPDTDEDDSLILEAMDSFLC